MIFEGKNHIEIRVFSCFNEQLTEMMMLKHNNCKDEENDYQAGI